MSHGSHTWLSIYAVDKYLTQSEICHDCNASHYFVCMNIVGKAGQCMYHRLGWDLSGSFFFCHLFLIHTIGSVWEYALILCFCMYACSIPSASLVMTNNEAYWYCLGISFLSTLKIHTIPLLLFCLYVFSCVCFSHVIFWEIHHQLSFVHIASRWGMYSILNADSFVWMASSSKAPN